MPWRAAAAGVRRCLAAGAAGAIVRRGGEGTRSSVEDRRSRRRSMRGMMRAVAVCVTLLGGAVGWASAAKALPCADYVSTGMSDAPGVGHLQGTSTVTRQWEVSVAGITYQISEQYEVGTYVFDDGATVKIDCSDYTLFE
jgi:hypothetical protein